MTRLLLRLQIISIPRAVFAIALFSCYFGATWSHIFGREDIARERVAHKRATAYLVVAKIFVATVEAYRAYEQLAGCNEKRGSCCGRWRVKFCADANKHIARGRECRADSMLQAKEAVRLLTQGSGTEIHLVARPLAVAGMAQCRWQCSVKAEQKAMLPASGAVRLPMQLVSEHSETSGGTTGSNCGHRLVTLERGADLNIGIVLAVVSSSSREHRLDKISNRAEAMAASSKSRCSRCECLRMASGQGSMVNLLVRCNHIHVAFMMITGRQSCSRAARTVTLVCVVL